ncbi:MAG: acetyl-CoA acetyltransferase, partial [Candidatus Dormibacteria bacterium]
MTSKGRKAVIAGVATSDYPHLPDFSEQQVHTQAAERALSDAGLTFDDVDGYATTGFFPMYAVGMCEYLGLRPNHLDETNVGGASFEVLVEHAAQAVEAGVCDVVLITYGSVQLSQMGRRLGTGGGGGGMGPGGPAIYGALWGNTLVGSYALAARRHMHVYGTTPEQLAEIAVTMRRHAAVNPMAQYRDPITVGDVIGSRMVADPLHMLDCCV